MSTGARVNWSVALKEYADANKYTVDYSIQESGPAHDRTFDATVRIQSTKDQKAKDCIITNLEAKGTGKTKKAARHQAALALIVLIDETEEARDGSVSRNRGWDDGNLCIRELEELCQKNNWSTPAYIDGEEHTGCHVCRCIVTAILQTECEVEIRAKGSGSCKRSAKRTAAEYTLRLVNKLLNATTPDPEIPRSQV